MFQQTTITLDDEAASFLQAQSDGDQSAFIARLIREERQRVLREAVLTANREEAGDADYQDELAEWEETVGDGGLMGCEPCNL